MPDDDRARSGHARRTAVALPALVLFGAAAILVVLSVALGPMNVTTPGWLDSDIDAGDAPEHTPEPMPSLSNLPTQQPIDETDGINFDLSVPWQLALVLVLILALVIAYVVYKRWPRRNLSGRIVGGEIDETVEELRQAAEDASGTLDRGGGPADEAIIAAWLRLEGAAAATGDTRLPHQTPSEFTAALLRHHNAGEAAVRQLLDLYERARFSITPDIAANDVATARAALATIMQTLGAVTPASDAS